MERPENTCLYPQSECRACGDRHESYAHIETGITLRQHFAIEALKAILSNINNHIDGDTDPQKYSKLSFEYADAMLAEGKTPTP